MQEEQSTTSQEDSRVPDPSEERDELRDKKITRQYGRAVFGAGSLPGGTLNDAGEEKGLRTPGESDKPTELVAPDDARYGATGF